ncbi:MAG TPA: zinc-dependent metalloprotease [Acidimicrobiales bacterium]|nr:zinc-dependent metalloprotease [Acidimicrobiales bacterium]
MSETRGGSAADLVDFSLASRICARALGRSVPLPADVAKRLEIDALSLTRSAYERVSAATGLVSPEGSPRALVLDRMGWAEANISSLGELLTKVDQPAQRGVATTHATTHAITRASSGTQVGLMFAWLSRHVLGQYDMVTGDPERDGIYYVGSNIYGLERRHGFAPSEFRLWIALHEVTHHLQFSGVPWMRAYFFDLIKRASAIGATNSQTFAEARSRAMEIIRRGENPLHEGGIAALLAGTKLFETMREAQALMSLLEGHAEYVMSVTAPDSIPGAKRFASVLRERREQGSPVAKFVQQALGFEAKLRQYHEGHAFIDFIVDAGGPELIALLWQARENIPDIEEIREPSRWIARIDGGSSRADNPHALS